VSRSPVSDRNSCRGSCCRPRPAERHVALERPAAIKIPLREAVVVARQIADGIENEHRGGVAHRDLKPSNIVVTRDRRGEPFVKVLDFGVARLSRTGQNWKDLSLYRNL
jgi:serine/threonine protein kinase